MTALLIIGIVAVICSSATGILVAVTSRRSVSDAFRLIEMNESRNEKHLNSVLDRLMTIKWEDYAVVREDYQGDTDEGGFFPPTGSPESDSLDDQTAEGGQWGQLRTRLIPDEHTQELLDEDFPEVPA